MLEFLGVYLENPQYINSDNLLNTQVSINNPELFTKSSNIRFLKKSNIPFQINLKSLNYFNLQQEISPQIADSISLCAKFVNNFFYLKNGIFIYGNAWTIQSNYKYKKYLYLLWKSHENYSLQEFNKYNKQLRLNNFKELYKKLDKESNPEGLIGFLYHFSNYKSELKTAKFKQTHITYCSGRKRFTIKNTTSKNLKIREILTQEYGYLTLLDEQFVTKRGINLNQSLKPQETYFYNDYLIEEQFRKLTHRSLLAIFLQKQRNDKVTWLLAPVSYSQLSLDLIQEKQNQQNIFNSIDGVLWVSKDDYKKYWKINYQKKAVWDKFLNKYFQTYFINNSILLPIPQNLARF